MPRESTKELICKGLGYCCEYAFFNAHKHVRPYLIAARLGVSKKTVQYKRVLFNEGEMKCQNHRHCIEKLRQKR